MPLHREGNNESQRGDCMSRTLPDRPGLMDPGVFAATPTRVAEVMTREVVTLSPRHSFQEAITLVARHRFRHLLVVGADARLAGVISDRDLLRFMAREPHWDTAAVGGGMETPPVTLRAGNPPSPPIAGV